METRVTGQPAAAAGAPAGARVEGNAPTVEAPAAPRVEGEDSCSECGGMNGEHKENCSKAPAARERVIRTEAAAAERTRITGIRALGKPGEERTIQACIDDASCTVEMAAKRLREAETSAGADRLAALRNDDAGQHPTNAAAPTDATPQAAASRAVASYYELTQPKGSTERAR